MVLWQLRQAWFCAVVAEAAVPARFANLGAFHAINESAVAPKLPTLDCFVPMQLHAFSGFDGAKGKSSVGNFY